MLVGLHGAGPLAAVELERLVFLVSYWVYVSQPSAPTTKINKNQRIPSAPTTKINKNQRIPSAPTTKNNKNQRKKTRT